MAETTVMSAAERAYEVIRGGILDGTFGLGARLPEEDLEEIFQLRALLESYAASRAARRIDAARLLALHELADGMDAAARRGTAAALDRIAELNNRLHRAILTIAG